MRHFKQKWKCQTHFGEFQLGPVIFYMEAPIADLSCCVLLHTVFFLKSRTLCHSAWNLSLKLILFNNISLNILQNWKWYIQSGTIICLLLLPPEQLAGAGRSWQELTGAGRSWQELAGAGRSWQELAGDGRCWQQLAARYIFQLIGYGKS